mgnify:CR=1 FL=1
MATPARPAPLSAFGPNGVLLKSFLPQMMQRAQDEGIRGAVPRTLLARNVRVFDDEPFQDISVRTTTPSQILRENAYGDFWDVVRNSLKDGAQNDPYLPEADKVGDGLDDLTYVMYGKQAADGTFPANAASGRHLGEDYGEYGEINLPLPTHLSEIFPGHAGTMAHEARHIAWPTAQRDMLMTPEHRQISQGDYAKMLLEPSRALLAATPWRQRDRLTDLAHLASRHFQHTNKNQEFFANLGDLKADHYARTGQFPMGVEGNRQFIQGIIDTPTPKINRDARYHWELLEPDEEYKFGPLKGTRSRDIPTLREQFKAALPTYDPEMMERIIRAAPGFASKQPGADHAA